jgi:hypothetical protein
MHAHSISHWRHHHAFLGSRHDRHERRTWFVVALTAVMMVAEIVGGTWFGSMALVADGWHMATHLERSPSPALHITSRASTPMIRVLRSVRASLEGWPDSPVR